MSGMDTGLSATNSTVVSAFYAALLKEGLVIVAIFALVALAFQLLAVARLRRAGANRDEAALAPRFSNHEPSARRLLRISFGLIWALDGLLQAQRSMPLGMVPQVIQPTAAESPPWVQHLVSTLTTAWTYHPVAAASAAVWIQVGIGVWLLAAPRGNWSRLAGLSSIGWGLIVWVFGESFGGIFTPGGLSGLMGAPGAALFYSFAGVLIALPESAWTTPRLGRVVLRVMGVFLFAAAVVQALPSQGFWQGQPRAGTLDGALPSMANAMSQTPQPHVFSSLLSRFAQFAGGHGWELNLLAVIALAAIGAAFLVARPRAVRVAVMAGIVFCAADWVLVQDFGFFGGVGTDPNSMIPIALLFIAGYVALVRAPAASRVDEAAMAHCWRQRLTTEPAYAFRSLAALAALGITLVGAVPMAVAATSPHAAAILNQAVDGTPNLVDAPAPAFRLSDQYGRTVSLASLRGKAIALTTLDPVCTSDCPVIAQEFREADNILGPNARHVELIAIDANLRYITRQYLVAFDRQEHLDRVSNWLYLTGSLKQLEHVWRAIGATVLYESGGGMVDHSEYSDVIDPDGNIRYILNTDPGPATGATKSSFSVVLANALERALRSS